MQAIDGALGSTGDLESLLSSSTALLLESAHRLARSRASIRRSYRRLRTIRGGANEPTITERVRAALASGALPYIAGIDGSRSWVGRGTQHPCGVCGARIEPAQIEHELDIPGMPPVHAECLRIWREESQNPR